MNINELISTLVSLNWSFEQIVTIITLIILGMAVYALMKRSR